MISTSGHLIPKFPEVRFHRTRILSFGRTPVEAALFLKPVISTRATSLEEATCGMVHYIEDPRDDEELAKAIVKLLANPDSPERLMEIKNVFAQKYCAEAIVKEYMKVFGITTA